MNRDHDCAVADQCVFDPSCPNWSNCHDHNLVAFLLRRFDEDEADVMESRALKPDDLHWAMPPWLHRDRLLTEIKVKRALLEQHRSRRWPYRSQSENHHGEARLFCRTCGYVGRTAGVMSGEEYPCTTLRLLALPYADEPGFRDEWSVAQDQPVRGATT